MPKKTNKTGKSRAKRAHKKSSSSLISKVSPARTSSSSSSNYKSPSALIRSAHHGVVTAEKNDAENANDASDAATNDNTTAKAVESSLSQPQQQPPEQDVKGLTKGQLKKLVKDLPYAKRKQIIMSSLRVKRMDNVRLAGMMDTLKEALDKVTTAVATTSDDHTAPAPAAAVVPAAVVPVAVPAAVPAPTTNKAKQKLATKEIRHMGLVLEHASFQENPFAAIQEHLKNSLADQAKQQTMVHENVDREQTKKRIQKKQKKKELLSAVKQQSSMHKKKRKNHYHKLMSAGAVEVQGSKPNTSHGKRRRRR